MIVGYEHVNDRLSEDRDVENQRKWVEAPGGFEPAHRNGLEVLITIVCD